MFETYQRPLRQPCQEVTSALQICYRAHGKNGEDCVREELSHKKCFAQMLCHREAYRFYDERKVPLSGAGWGGGGGGRATCATLVEVFAKVSWDRTGACTEFPAGRRGCCDSIRQTVRRRW